MVLPPGFHIQPWWRSEGCTANWFSARVPHPTRLAASHLPPGGRYYVGGWVEAPGCSANWFSARVPHPTRLAASHLPPGGRYWSGGWVEAPTFTVNWFSARIPLPSALRAATFSPGEGIACGVFLIIAKRYHNSQFSILNFLLRSPSPRGKGLCWQPGGGL